MDSTMNQKGNSNRDEEKRLQTTSVIMWLHYTVPAMWKCMLYKSFCLKLSVCIPTRSSSSQPEFFCTYYSTEHGKYQRDGGFFSTLPKGISMGGVGYRLSKFVPVGPLHWRRSLISIICLCAPVLILGKLCTLQHPAKEK